MKIRNVGLAALATLTLVPAVAPAQQGDWLVAPYIWTADVSWDLAARGDGSVALSDFGLADSVEAIARGGQVRHRSDVGQTADSSGTACWSPSAVPGRARRRGSAGATTPWSSGPVPHEWGTQHGRSERSCRAELEPTL